MASYSFQRVLVWDVNPGGTVRTLRNGTVTVKSADDDSTLFNVTSDNNGLATFTTTDVATVYLVSPNGLVSEHITAASAIEAAAAAGINNDAGVASFVSDTGSATRAALNSTYEAKRSTLVASGSDTAASVNTFLAAASPLGVKKLIGGFTVAASLTFAGKHLDLSDATITTSVTTTDALTVTGDNATISGGTITGPASWDGTNSEWTYAVIRCTGANPTVRGVTLNNVRRVGIGFKNATGVCRALDNTIVGNYPAAQWTEVETVHLGIGFDPGAGARLNARGNDISSCVQGMLLGNFGAGSSVGSIVSGNHFEGCHNHAVYVSAGITNAEVTSNTTVDCSRPIAMTGSGHDVSHNNFTTTLSSGNLSEACGIDMRDAVDCTVSFNTMKGSVHASGAAIQLARTGTNVTVTGNRVVGNRIEITGTNTGLGIKVGTATETTMFGNIVADNDVKAPGLSGQGVIGFFGANGSQSYGNKCLNNRVTIAGNTNGIYAAEQRGIDINGNTIRLEYSSGSAIVLGGVFITANTTGHKVRHNDFEVPSTFGSNVTFRAYYEATAGVTGGRVGPNRYSLDTTLLTAGVTHIVQATSSTVLNEVGMTGAPTTVCGPGSTWSRADGGASTTFYVKETAANSATWRAV